MPWLAIELDVPQSRVNALSDALLEAGAAAVDVAPGEGFADEVLEPAPGAMVAWQRSRLRALVDPCGSLALDLAPLRHALADLDDCGPLDVSFVEDADWLAAWRNDAKAYQAGTRLIVAPAHARIDPAFTGVVVRIDPGLAFGSGSHPTTRLCLDWLARADLAGRSLLDYGCGCGILAVAAGRLGAARVAAIDHDPQALVAARANAEANGVRLEAVSLPGAFHTPARFDVVIANILAAPLIDLARSLEERVVPGGWLVLSGLLAPQADEVAASYARVRFEPAVERDGWVRLDGVRQIDV